MSSALSSKSQVGYNEESVYGTPVAATLQPGILQTFDPTVTPNIQRLRGTNWGRSAKWLIAALRERSFSFETRVQNGRLLKVALGSVATTGLDPYTHTISEAETLPSFTFEHAIQDLTTGGVTRKYAGAKVNTATLSGADMGTPLTLALECIAKDVTKDTWANKSTVTEVTTKPYLMEQNVLEIPDGTQYDGAVDNWNLRIAEGLQPVPDTAGGIKTIKWLSEGNRDYDLTLNVTPTSKALYEALIDETDQTTIYFLFTRGANDTLEIQLSGSCMLDQGEIPQPADVGPFKQPLTFIVQTCAFVIVDSLTTGPGTGWTP